MAAKRFTAFFITIKVRKKIFNKLLKSAAKNVTMFLTKEKGKII